MMRDSGSVKLRWALESGSPYKQLILHPFPATPPPPGTAKGLLYQGLSKMTKLRSRTCICTELIPGTSQPSITLEMAKALFEGDVWR